MKTLDPDFPVFKLAQHDDNYMLLCEMEPDTDTDGRVYEMVTQCLEDDDFYQGLNMITVIRRKSDGKLFGYSWWNDISKHGSPYMESNGDEFGLEAYEDTEGDDGWCTFYVFEPVHQNYDIVSYKKVTE